MTPPQGLSKKSILTAKYAMTTFAKALLVGESFGGLKRRKAHKGKIHKFIPIVIGILRP